MADKWISVDDILREVDAGTKGVSKSEMPKSSMDEVNSMIEQILIEKKNRELKENNESLSQDDREQLEREIKQQSRTIAKQYEKSRRETTRKLKKFEKTEAEIARELNTNGWQESFNALEEELQKHSTMPIKLTAVHPEQKVKLDKSIAQITASLPNKEKIDAYKQSAHIDHIKREAMNITSHFGGFKDGKEHMDEPKQESTASTIDGFGNEININSFRKYKRSRNEKIDSFVLDSSKAAKNANEKSAADDDVDDAAITEMHGIPIDETAVLDHPDMQAHAAGDKKPIPMIHSEDEEVGYTFNSEEDTERIVAMVKSKQLFAHIATIGLTVLSVISAILMFAKVDVDVVRLPINMDLTHSHFILANLGLLFGACIFGFGVIKNTVASIITREPTKDVLYFAALIVAFALTIMLMLAPEKLIVAGVHLYSPVLVISMMFNSLSSLIVANKTSRNLNYILEDNSLHTVSLVDDDNVSAELTKGIVDEEIYLAKNVKTNTFTRFIENSFKSNRCDDFGSKLCVLIFPVSLVIAIGVFLLSKNIYIALTLFSCIMTLSATFIGGLLVAFPLKDTAKIIEHFAGMSPCSDSIIQLEEVNSVLLDAYELFPKGTVKLQGIKTFSGKRIDNAILDAASVLCECKSALSHVFLDVIANNKAILKPVDSIIYEDLMGISAWVDNKRVLIGNRELMINHSIAVPKKEYEDKYHELNQDIVYIAAEGNLCAAFIIGITTKKGIYDAVNLLRRNHISFAVKSVDALLTSEKIAAVFGIEEDCLKLIPSRLHNSFMKEHEPKDQNDILVGNNGSLLGFIISLVTTKKLSSCITSGIVLNIFSIVLGIALVCVLYFFDQMQLIGSPYLAAYLAAFGIIYWVYQKNTHI